MKKEIIELAANVMRIPVEKAQEHFKEIDGMNAYYFWNPIRGGIAVIINDDGEKLAATSSVSYGDHLKAFQAGRRN